MVLTIQLVSLLASSFAQANPYSFDCGFDAQTRHPELSKEFLALEKWNDDADTMLRSEQHFSGSCVALKQVDPNGNMDKVKQFSNDGTALAKKAKALGDRETALYAQVINSRAALMQDRTGSQGCLIQMQNMADTMKARMKFVDDGAKKICQSKGSSGN